jgi:hypothetical protein
MKNLKIVTELEKINVIKITKQLIRLNIFIELGGSLLNIPGIHDEPP